MCDGQLRNSPFGYDVFRFCASNVCSGCIGSLTRLLPLLPSYYYLPFFTYPLIQEALGPYLLGRCIAACLRIAVRVRTYQRRMTKLSHAGHGRAHRSYGQASAVLVLCDLSATQVEGHTENELKFSLARQTCVELSSGAAAAAYLNKEVRCTNARISCNEVLHCRAFNCHNLCNLPCQLATAPQQPSHVLCAVS